jgi:hypothetical protein
MDLELVSQYPFSLVMTRGLYLEQKTAEATVALAVLL